MTSVEVTVSSAVAALDKKLLSVLFSRYRLRQHLDAIKRYLLLGQGDFIETFMGLVGGQLDQPVSRPAASRSCAPQRQAGEWDAVGDNMRGRLCRRLNFPSMPLQAI